MTVEKHQQEIKELYLSQSKVAHKFQDRIELYQTLNDLAEKYPLPAYVAWYKLLGSKKFMTRQLAIFKKPSSWIKPYLTPGTAKVMCIAI